MKLMRVQFIYFTVCLFIVLFKVMPSIAASKKYVTPNCGNNFNCYIKKANTCSLAKVSFLKKNAKDALGVTQGDVTTSYNILGIKDGKCIFTIQSSTKNLRYTKRTLESLKRSGLSDAVIKIQLKKVQAELANVYTSCRADKNLQLIKFLKNQQKGDSSVDCHFSEQSSSCIYGEGITCDSGTVDQ